MSTQHTPGPWQHGIENEGYFIANGELRPDIAKCIRSRADADLIAAAPDLLEAIKGLLESVTDAINAGDWKVDGVCDPDIDIQRANAAIAKATGEQP